jgi:preprotein translocase subunit SecG
MITILIAILTVLLVLDALILVLLILIQLPKKEAGAGVAFGGGATDALFGAGSGNALTKITKYAAGAFFVLCLTLSLLYTHNLRSSGASAAMKALTQQQNSPTPVLPATNLLAPRVQGNPAPSVPATNLSVPTLTIPTNVPSAK